MEQLTETIELDIEESNELAFKIKMEGAASSPAKVRLVCEGKDFSYMFNGYGTGEPEVVQFTIPQMSSKIQEGVYGARVEVLVENRYFAPVQFQINFKKTLSVVAEAIQVKPKAKHSEIKITATPVITTQKSAPVAQIKFEQRPLVVENQAAVSVPPQKPISVATVKKSISSLKEAYLKKSSSKKDDEDLDDETLHQIAKTILHSKTGK